jgi:hypothetical protein
MNGQPRVEWARLASGLDQLARDLDSLVIVPIVEASQCA